MTETETGTDTDSSGSSDGRSTGQVKWFNNTKGYGFIVCDDRPELGDLFAHYSSIAMDGYKTLKAGQQVSFVVAEGPKGLHAADIQSTDSGVDGGFEGDASAGIDVQLPDPTPAESSLSSSLSSQAGGDSLDGPLASNTEAAQQRR